MKRIKLILSAVMLMLAVGVSAQTYTWVEKNKSFTDGTLLYTLGSYQDANNSTITLESNEVAVSLYLTNDNTDQLTDVINYNVDGDYTKASPAYTSLSNNDRQTLRNLRVGTSTTISDIRYTRLEDGRSNTYRWQRTFSASKIKTNNATSVSIPTTVIFNNKEYDVVAIPYGGFIFPEFYTEMWRDYCTTDGSTNVNSHRSTCLRGGNPYLEKITIPNDSKIRDIGAYAFAGCVKLKSIQIPKTVVAIKEAAFEMCKTMTTVAFQTESNSTESALRLIGNYVFYDDEKLEKLIFPEGLQEIGGYSIMYVFSLNEIKLPSTLNSIGAHFLCDASSLTTLTIPANVTFINGAFLHGCQNLKTVYMLGYAQYLDKETSDKNGEAFDYNNSYCKLHVNNCTFYVPSNFIEDYQKHAVWSLIDDSGRDTYIRDNKGTNHQGYKNVLTTLPGTERDFGPNKWVTAIFPKAVTNYNSNDKFGSKARFAVFTGAKRIADAYDESVGHMVRMYDLSFKIIDGNDIPAATPGMFYTGDGFEEYQLWEMSDETIEFTQDMSRPHTGEYAFTATDDPDNAYIFMSGYYVPYTMKDYDFYFSANQFWRVPEGTNVEIGTCRCFWTVTIDGLPASVSAKPSRFFDETNGIGTITIAVDEPTEVYDLSGRKLNATDKLKSGIYIINGKKVVVK